MATAAKTIRDGALADMLPEENFSRVLRGSQYSRALVWMVAGISVVLPPYAILADGFGDSDRFALISLAYLFSSTLNMAKAARDSFDADFFDALLEKPAYANDPAMIRALSNTAAGTTAFKGMNILSTAASFGVGIAGVWSNEGLARERKALFTTGLLFLSYAAFQVSKLVRDYSDPRLEKARPKSAYATFTFIGFAVAGLMHGGAIMLMPVTEEQRRFFGLGSSYLLSSVLALAKILRDDDERETGEGQHKD